MPEIYRQLTTSSTTIIAMQAVVLNHTKHQGRHSLDEGKVCKIRNLMDLFFISYLTILPNVQNSRGYFFFASLNSTRSSLSQNIFNSYISLIILLLNDIAVITAIFKGLCKYKILFLLIEKISYHYDFPTRAKQSIVN